MTTTRQRILLSATLSLCFAHLACDSGSSKATDASIPSTTLKDGALPDQPSLPDLGGNDLADAPVGDAPAGPDTASAKDTAAATPDASADSLAFEVLRGEVASDVTKARMDAPADVASCTGSGGDCNDDPLVSAIWGTCQADGTCACKPGFEINPSTGRCRMPRADAADGTATCSGEFKACGCGCCGEPRDIACYYPPLGESTATLRAKDDAAKASADCTAAGCSRGVKYVCCMPVGTAPSAATYSTSSYMGDMDHITISKSGSDCATLRMSLPSTTSSELRIDGPSRWGISGYLGSCEAGAGSAAKGALGTVAMYPRGEACLVDVHVTLFAIANDGTVMPTSLDVDGLPVTDFPASFCQ